MPTRLPFNRGDLAHLAALREPAPRWIALGRRRDVNDLTRCSFNGPRNEFMWEYLQRSTALYHGVIREHEPQRPVRKLLQGRLCFVLRPPLWLDEDEGEPAGEGEAGGGKPGTLIMMYPQA